MAGDKDMNSDEGMRRSKLQEQLVFTVFIALIQSMSLQKDQTSSASKVCFQSRGNVSTYPQWNIHRHLQFVEPLQFSNNLKSRPEGNSMLLHYHGGTPLSITQSIKTDTHNNTYLYWTNTYFKSLNPFALKATNPQGTRVCLKFCISVVFPYLAFMAVSCMYQYSKTMFVGKIRVHNCKWRNLVQSSLTHTLFFFRGEGVDRH